MKFIDEFVLNKVSETESYGVDLRNAEQVVIQFQGPSSFFANGIDSGKSVEAIVEEATNNFEGASESQVKKDFNSFIESLKDLNVIQA